MPVLMQSADGTIWRKDRRFDPWLLDWVEEAPPSGLTRVGAREALRLAMSGKRVRRVPIGVIGPREPEPRQKATAYEVGYTLATLGVQMACGGKGGVMEAACQGHLEAGGAPIGFLPDEEWTGANPYVAIPIATGIGTARNAILARACTALIAVGGGYGTLSEMAFGLHWDRLVLTLEGAPEVPGAVTCSDTDAVIDRLAGHMLRLEELPTLDRPGSDTALTVTS